MMPSNYRLRKFVGSYKLINLQETINHLLYMNDIKLFVKNEKELETLMQTKRIYSQHIRITFGKKSAILTIKKWEKTDKRRNRTIKS